MEHHKITRSATVFGGFTLVSRVLGMARDMVIAHLFGTSFAMSAYTIAFTFPNLFRRLFGEGTLVGAFIPVFTEQLEKKGKEAAFGLAAKMIPFVFFFLTALTIGVILILATIRFYFPLSPQAQLVFSLTQWMMPYMVLICTAALFMGILNSLSHFAVPALSPCVLNLSLIFFGLVICPWIPGSIENKVYGLAAGVVIGGALQFLVHLPILKRKGVRLNFHLSMRQTWQDPTVRRILTLMLPGILGLSVNQLNVIVDRFLAYLISEQAAAVLFYGDRLVEFPLGIFGIGLATAILPSLSRHAARQDVAQLKLSLVYALRQVFFITVPATVGLVVLGQPIVKLLFERGAFDAASTRATAAVLVYYSLGIFAYSGIKIVVPAFYALKEMKTPVKIAFIALGVNVVLNLTLMWFMEERGLALSTSISSVVNLTLLIFCLRKKIGAFSLKLLLLSCGRILFVSLLMGALAYWAWYELVQRFGEATTGARLLSTFGAMALALVGYFVFSWLFRLPELKELRQAFARKPKTVPKEIPSEDPPLRGE